MNRKGQGISINVIVIAAIALLILVILSVLVIRAGSKTSGGTTCESLGGTCVVDGTYSPDRCGPGQSYDPITPCPSSSGITKNCCRTI